MLRTFAMSMSSSKVSKASFINPASSVCLCRSVVRRKGGAKAKGDQEEATFEVIEQIPGKMWGEKRKSLVLKVSKGGIAEADKWVAAIAALCPMQRTPAGAALLGTKVTED